jgi:tetratricopeptide (TPR) repeat protein
MTRLFVLLLLLAPLAGADTLALMDGRFVDNRPIEKAEGGYKIQFQNGEILVPDKMIVYVFRNDESIEFTPKTEKEKEKFEKGQVPWKGRWISKSYAAKLRAKELEARKKRIDQMLERRFWRNHAVVKSKRWVFLHTLPDEIFSEFVQMFEDYFEFYCKFWKIRPPPKFGKPTMHIYHNEEYFHQVSGAPAGAAGYYLPSKRELHFYYDRAHHDFALAVMFHETSHLLTHMVSPKMDYPAWLNEGMAEVFGGTEYNPQTGQMEIGAVQSGRLAVLQSSIEDESWMGLEKLMRSPRIDALGYAWAWSFCHFLITSERYSKGFKKYFLAMGRSRSIRRRREGRYETVDPNDAIAALKRYLRVKDLEALQKEWHDAVKELIKRTDLDWHEAGYIMLLWGLEKKARRFFKKAIDAGSTNAFDYYNYARLQLNRGKWGVALNRAEEALKYDPLHARAWSVLGYAKYLDGDHEEGKRCIRLARELDPDDDRIWADEALVDELEAKEREAEAE